MNKMHMLTDIDRLCGILGSLKGTIFHCDIL